MGSEWLALRRVGEWAGLREDQMESYLTAAQTVHSQALEDLRSQDIGFDQIKSDYFQFLNENVLSADQVVRVLQAENVPRDIVDQFETGTVPISEAFKKRTKVDYKLDEIADFVMLIKLIDYYEDLTGQPSIKPLEKFHSLVYLVNQRISEGDASHLIEDTHGFGMLWKTGYRYTFEKRENYVWSDSLQRDIDRLFSWKIMDRMVIENPKPGWEILYSVRLDEAANMFLSRFKGKIDGFDSVLLREWELHQDSVLEDLGDSSMTAIADHLESLDQFNETKSGNVILNGRPKKFKSRNQKEEDKANV